MAYYEVWVDADNRKHEISQMDSGYIINCLKQLQIWANTWRNDKVEDLTTSEMKMSDEVGQKAWYLTKGQGYITAFTKELADREAQKSNNQS